MEKAVKGVGICDSLATDLLYLFTRVGKEANRGETPRWGKARVQSTDINHDDQAIFTGFYGERWEHIA